MFHIGHLNLLKNSKANSNKLIVGITTDELILLSKGKKPVIPFAERMEIIRQCNYVDETVVQDDLDKFIAWEKYKYDILFSGDDWQGSPRWCKYERRLNEVGAEVRYFPYTREISTSGLFLRICNISRESCK
jgi:glycerol-3-phosphate cytidylyltransferase